MENYHVQILFDGHAHTRIMSEDNARKLVKAYTELPNNGSRAMFGTPDYVYDLSKVRGVSICEVSRLPKDAMSKLVDMVEKESRHGEEWRDGD